MSEPSLLITQFTVPPVRARLLPRADLIDRLNKSCALPLVLLSACAGFGKTTLLAAGSVRTESTVWLGNVFCDTLKAIDQDGNLVDSMLSQKRDMDAAKRFFQQALQTVGHAPEQVITDGHRSYPCAIREILGKDILHRCNHFLNSQLEQDHRGINRESR